MKTEKFVFFLVILMFCFEITNVIAQVHDPVDKKSNKENAWDKISELKKKAMLELGMIKSAESKKNVKKGKRPEIILLQDKIYFNAKELRLGYSLESWKKIIPGAPRCNGPKISLCIWDELGIDIGLASEGAHKVKFLNIQISMSKGDKEKNNVNYPDGRRAGELLDLNPYNVFPGYLELDGFGIDAGTEFWEIRRNVNQDRLLDCGLRDCSHPSGAFGESAHIYLRLDSGSRYGRLRQISVDADD